MGKIFFNTIFNEMVAGEMVSINERQMNLQIDPDREGKDGCAENTGN